MKTTCRLKYTAKYDDRERERERERERDRERLKYTAKYGDEWYAYYSCSLHYVLSHHHTYYVTSSYILCHIIE
jgi:hypothetical protein